MAILLLIRHGKNDMVDEKLAGRLPDVHLNNEGQAQARLLAAKLAPLPINAVFASPLERAQETADPIARGHGLTIETLTALQEVDYGDWQGQSLKQLKRKKLWKQVQDHPDKVRFPNGESLAEAQTRVSEALTAISDKFEEKDWIVCVAHSDVIRLAVAHFLGMPLANLQRLRIDTASVSVLYLNEGKAYFGPINHYFDFPDFKE